MHIVFLTIPSSGEFNVQFATAQELINNNHRVTFLSGASFHKHVERFRRSLAAGGDEKKKLNVDFISLGAQRSVEDFTPVVQERIHEMRQVPGNATSIETCIDLAMVSPEEHASTALVIKELLGQLDPDMIIVDVLSPAMITGVRLSQRKFLLTIPCSPGMTALPSFFNPHPIAGDRSGSWMTLFENTYLKTRQLLFCASRSSMRAKRSLLKNTFKLKSFGLAQDLTLLPPYWEDPDCLGGIHFNTFALTDCVQQPPSVVFVGAGVTDAEDQLPPKQGQAGPSRPSSPTKGSEEITWMDQAWAQGDDVVYVNMGSMFIWTQAEFEAIIEALKDVYDMSGGKTRFLFKINRPIQSTSQATAAPASTPSPAPGSMTRSRIEEDVNFAATLSDSLPSYIKVTNWIECQHSVYRHPALKVFVHHGGGNSFNEAVHFAVPQLVLSQWLDTHEYGSLAAQFGFGLRSARPPLIETMDVREKLLELLGPRWTQYKSKASVWSLRSKLGGGPKAAAKIIECHAENQKNEDEARKMNVKVVSAQ